MILKGGVIIATFLFVWSIVPRHCARLTYFLHPNLREIIAVLITPELIPLPCGTCVSYVVCPLFVLYCVEPLCVVLCRCCLICVVKFVMFLFFLCFCCFVPMLSVVFSFV